jgi:serine/threonine protein kinase
VKLVHDAKTKKLLAMKCLKRRNINKYLEAEIVNHSLLRHPHVVQFKEVFLTSEYVNIVMEYANGGSLFDLVRTQKRLKETQVRVEALQPDCNPNKHTGGFSVHGRGVLLNRITAGTEEAVWGGTICTCWCI